MATVSVVQFRRQLVDLDTWLKEHQPDVFRSLQRPATEKQLASLNTRLFPGKPLPPLLKTWFQWHNGQSLDGSAFLPLYKHSPFYLSPISEVIQTWRDMKALERYGELSGPWLDGWVPLLSGEYGDILVFVTSGKDKNAIRACWHESSKREVVSKDIVAFLTRARRELSKTAEQAENGTQAMVPPSVAVPKGWVKGSEQVLTGSPSESQLAQDAIGTAYLVGPFDMPLFYPSKAHYVAVKVADDLWISVFEKSRDDALLAIRDATANIPKKKWAHTNGDIAGELASEHNIWKRKIRQRRVDFES